MKGEEQMVHCFSINNCNIALDVHSGAVHILNDLAYEILSRGLDDMCIQSLNSKYSHETVAEAKAEINTLIAQGQLFAKPAPGIKEGEISFTQNRAPVVKALCMHIAHDCNLRCTYCFAGEGDYGTIDRTLMPLEVGIKAIDFLIKNSGSRQNLEVDFFGGEPTLNFDVVKAIIEYARNKETKLGKNFRFTLTTNGLLLDQEKIEYINKNINNVVLSLDGRKKINDKMRKSIDAKSSSYDRVLPKFWQLVEARGHQNYYMRGTYTRENLDFCSDVLHMAELGFSQISIEPVVGPVDASYSIRMEDVPILCEAYERLAIEMANRNQHDKNCGKHFSKKFNFFHFMLDMTNGPCAAKRITGCGAGTEYLAVTPEGDLYPCHQFVGDRQFHLGDLDSGIVQTKWQEKFAHCNVYTKPECNDCWAKYFCSGGCAANAFHISGDIMKPDKVGCELQKKRLECALYLLAANAN